MGQLGQSSVETQASRVLPHALFVLMSFGAVVLLGMVGYYVGTFSDMTYSAQSVETFLIGGFIAVVASRVVMQVKPPAR